MKFAIRLFTAFCVATVIAQLIIFGLSAARGNLSGDSMMRTIALLNGIDITGDRLQKMLDESRKAPVPEYQDVVRERAEQDKVLDMREMALQRAQQQLDEQMAMHKSSIADFDRRRNEFFDRLEQMEKDLGEQSLREVQITLEALSPEQAKDHMIRMMEVGKNEDVVAIVKGMAVDKRKKILGEFVNEANKEPDKLHQILLQLLDGQPTQGLIDKARKTNSDATT